MMFSYPLTLYCLFGWFGWRVTYGFGVASWLGVCLSCFSSYSLCLQGGYNVTDTLTHAFGGVGVTFYISSCLFLPSVLLGISYWGVVFAWTAGMDGDCISTTSCPVRIYLPVCTCTYIFLPYLDQIGTWDGGWRERMGGCWMVGWLMKD